jgi:lipopolysaccharide/colanic/teichoic acid biosynthesis glycosyltransferase
MHKLLEEERLRADRAGLTFTVVTFGPVHEKLRSVVCRELSRILSDRLRRSDRAGLLRSGCIGLFLPDTPPAGAEKLCQDVHQRWSVEVPAPEFEVYVHPYDSMVRLDAGSPAEPPSSVERTEKSAQVLVAKRTPFWKRVLDIVGASVGLMVLTPLFAVVALAVKLSSPGPVFFRQMRRGRGGQPFRLYKFRSMVVDAEERKKELLAMNEQDGPAFKMARDPRVTKVGRFLRATHIDELPQLWNVLKGDMSLVGPRPLPCEEADAIDGWQRQRLDVTPGLTCFWQVSKERSRVPFVDWVRMDLRYIKGRSPKLDLALLVKTARRLLPWNN